MYGVIIVKVKDTLLMNVQPQKDSKLGVYFCGGNHVIQECWNLKQQKMQIKSIQVNLILGNENKMDLIPMLIIILKEILIAYMIH